MRHKVSRSVGLNYSRLINRPMLMCKPPIPFPSSGDRNFDGQYLPMTIGKTEHFHLHTTIK